MRASDTDLPVTQMTEYYQFSCHFAVPKTHQIKIFLNDFEML